MIAFILAAFLFVICVLFTLTRRNNDEPPGPMALPIIGHLHLIGFRSLHIVLKEMAMKYGDIFTLKFASRKAVILCSRELIHEAFVKNAKKFAGRPNLPTFQKTRNGQTGISLCDYSEEYAENRRSTIKALHNFFSEKENLNNMLKEEAEKMVKHFDEYASIGTYFNPLDEFGKITPSMFLKLMFNVSFSYSDQRFVEIAHVYNEWFENAETDNPTDFFPLLENLPNKRLDIAAKCGECFQKFSTSFMSSSEENTREKSLFGQFYINEVNSNDEKMSKKRLLSVAKIISDLLGGGFDTSTATLSWAILYLQDQSDVLEKCLEEVRRNHDGKGNRSVSLEDKLKYPYLSATIYEIIRLSTVAPLALPHTVISDDATLSGYHIEKDTMVIAHLWDANHDGEFWEDPDKFIPDRFLSKSGEFEQSYTNDVMSFSSGIRRCPGEKIAVSMLFVILGTLLKNYDIKMIQQPSDMLPRRGLTLKPKHYTISLTCENH